MRIHDRHPSGMLRVELGYLNIQQHEYDYIIGALAERGIEWEQFVKDALLEEASP